MREWGARLASDLDRNQAFQSNMGSIELTASTSTEVKNGISRKGYAVFLQPRSASAVSAAAYVSAVNDGAFTVTHEAGDASGRLFWYFLR